MVTWQQIRSIYFECVHKSHFPCNLRSLIPISYDDQGHHRPPMRKDHLHQGNFRLIDLWMLNLLPIPPAVNMMLTKCTIPMSNVSSSSRCKQLINHRHSQYFQLDDHKSGSIQMKKLTQSSLSLGWTSATKMSHHFWTCSSSCVGCP